MIETDIGKIVKVRGKTNLYRVKKLGWFRSIVENIETYDEVLVNNSKLLSWDKPDFVPKLHDLVSVDNSWVMTPNVVIGISKASYRVMDGLGFEHDVPKDEMHRNYVSRSEWYFKLSKLQFQRLRSKVESDLEPFIGTEKYNEFRKVCCIRDKLYEMYISK